MLESQNNKELKLLVIQGRCPLCNSNKIQFYEHEKNKTFAFKCSACDWRNTYTLEDLVCASISWSWNNQTKD